MKYFYITAGTSFFSPLSNYEIKVWNTFISHVTSHCICNNCFKTLFCVENLKLFLYFWYNEKRESTEKLFHLCIVSIPSILSIPSNMSITAILAIPSVVSIPSIPPVLSILSICLFYLFRLFCLFRLFRLFQPCTGRTCLRNTFRGSRILFFLPET